MPHHTYNRGNLIVSSHITLPSPAARTSLRLLERECSFSDHKTQKAFITYIKLFSDEITDKINVIANVTKTEVF